MHVILVNRYSRAGLGGIGDNAVTSSIRIVKELPRLVRCLGLGVTDRHLNRNKINFSNASVFFKIKFFLLSLISYNL